MRAGFFNFSLIVLFCAVSVAQSFPQTDQWKRFSSAEGRFAILLPDQPVRTVQSKDTGAGRVVMSFFTTRSDDGVFIVAYADYSMGEAKRELNANRDSFLKGMKATLVSESDIKLQGNPGREIRASRDKLTIRSRIYLVGGRYYQMVAITPMTLPGDVEADRFLTSFELLRNNAPAAR